MEMMKRKIAVLQLNSINLPFRYNVQFLFILTDKTPYGARCNFEQDWCGWYNAQNKSLKWTRHNGTMSRNNTVPSEDHTYKNRTGNYLHVNAESSAAFATAATLKSVIFNPPPKVHGNMSSPYYNSCTVS